MVLDDLTEIQRGIVHEYLEEADKRNSQFVLTRASDIPAADDDLLPLSLTNLRLDQPPLIFLDIDGVLNRIDPDTSDDDDDGGDDDDASISSSSSSSSDASGAAARRIESRLIGRVQTIATSTEPRAAVVLSSDWRAQPEARDYVERRLARLGVSMVGCTPLARSRAHARPAEILRWLETTPHSGRWVVLDDRDLHREARGSRLAKTGRFVRVDPKRGLADADVDRAVAILRKDAPPSTPRS